MTRVILDTGIYVQAALSNGQGRWLLREAAAGKFQVVTSAKQLYELEQTLQQVSVRQKTMLTPSEEQTFVETVGEFAIVVTDARITAQLTHDPDDNWLVALAQLHGVPLITRETSIHKHHPDDVEVLHPDDFSATRNSASSD